MACAGQRFSASAAGVPSGSRASLLSPCRPLRLAFNGHRGGAAGIVGVERRKKGVPFPKQNPRAFTKANVEKLKKGQIGCYGLFKGDTWV
jgi:hypothetical protein